MRGLWIAGAAALLACSAPMQAGAQADAESLAGTWAFQTESYGSEQVGAIMSGAAVIAPASGRGYDIRLVAHERIVNRMTGEGRLLTARQTCTGAADGAQITVSCEMAEPLEGYQPDSFILQRGEADQLVGVLDSSAHAQVTFTRVR